MATPMEKSPKGLPGFLRRSLRLNEDEEEQLQQNAPLPPVTETALPRTALPPLPRVSSLTNTSINNNNNNNNGTAEPKSPRPSPGLKTGMPMATPAPSPAVHKATTSPHPPILSEKDYSGWSGDPPDPPHHEKSYKERQFDSTIQAEIVSLDELRKLSWNGIPPDHRAQAWKLMLGYLPTNTRRRKQALQRKRMEYKDAIAQHYDIDDDTRTTQEQETLRQVLVDVPRTAPDIMLFRNDRIRKSLSRLLYIWAMRHPASSYVQGINDLATPLIVVFLNDYFPDEDVLNGNIMDQVTPQIMEEIEADCYWCLTNLLAGIQDHYTSDQPGVQRMVIRLEELVTRIDADLTNYLKSVGIEFMQFAFKWMNCLLLREFNLRCVERLWDTYISEGDGGFEGFHVYVCAAFLCQFSTQLRSMEFDELFGFMQHMPTDEWTDTEIEILLSQAYVLSTLFGGSDAHLSNPNR